MTCKDCIHYEACHDMYYEEHATRHFDPEKHNAEKECGYFKDRSRFVELPCKVGDTVYIALNGYGVLKDTVKEFRITSRRIWIRPEEFGMDCLLENMAFLTREAAEQALKEREENEKTDD